jgi:2-hydroxy-3-keto-5-methylthiopentenyl-1-phosphate phosphatase
MSDTRAQESIAGVLVSDFDGTMTTHDFYRLALQSLIPTDVPDYWSAYRSGQITHFEALRRYFASIRKSEEEVMQVVWSMDLDPMLGDAVQKLREAGWRVIVASAGCDWYISRLLSHAHVALECHANPGRFEPGHGLLMELPTESPYFSRELGIDKTAIVQTFLSAGIPIAYAGDGFPDVAPAKLVPEHLCFARADLANVLRQEQRNFRSYGSWSDIARQLVERSP